MAKKGEFSDELEALKVVLGALSGLEKEKREFVIKTVCERLEIRAPKGPTDGGGSDDDNGDSGNQNNLTPKQFMSVKKPKTDVEKIACLAFYLTHFRGTQKFKTKEITDLNTDAAQSTISNPSHSVSNAMKQNHFLAPGGKNTKQITSLGEDVVNALPNREEVSKVLTNAQKPKRRKKRAAKVKPR